jgi:hypothetical protein
MATLGPFTTDPQSDPDMFAAFPTTDATGKVQPGTVDSVNLEMAVFVRDRTQQYRQSAAIAAVPPVPPVPLPQPPKPAGNVGPPV